MSTLYDEMMETDGVTYAGNGAEASLRLREARGLRAGTCKQAIGAPVLKIRSSSRLASYILFLKLAPFA